MHVRKYVGPISGSVYFQNPTRNFLPKFNFLSIQEVGGISGCVSVGFLVYVGYRLANIWPEIESKESHEDQF